MMSTISSVVASAKHGSSALAPSAIEEEKIGCRMAAEG